MKKSIKEMPKDLLQHLSRYGEQVFDSDCGECVGWGYEILHFLGEDKFNELRQYGELDCVYPTWFLITKRLTIENAIKKYGKITKIRVGPRGGYKGVVFGEEEFCVRELDPRDTKYFKQELVEVI